MNPSFEFLLLLDILHHYSSMETIRVMKPAQENHHEAKKKKKWLILKHAFLQALAHEKSPPDQYQSPPEEYSGEESVHDFSGFRIFNPESCPSPHGVLSRISPWRPRVYVTLFKAAQWPIFLKTQQYPDQDIGTDLQLSVAPPLLSKVQRWLVEHQHQVQAVHCETWNRPRIHFQFLLRPVPRPDVFDNQETHRKQENQETHQHPSASLFLRKEYTFATGHRLTMIREPTRAKVTFATMFSHELQEGVDNTGNVRCWPTEEVLGHVLLERRDTLVGKRCLELGAGRTGLSGFICAHVAQAKAVVITDGNADCVASLNAQLNEYQLDRSNRQPSSSLAVQLLRWNETQDQTQNRFDVIFASDCLFFREYHHDLCRTIQDQLEPMSGECLLLQPRRAPTMDTFVAIAREYFEHVQVDAEYDAFITARHIHLLQTTVDYVPDIHYPVLVILAQPKPR